MQAVKTRMREKVIIGGAIVILAVGAFLFAQKYVRDHANPRYPNPVAAVMGSQEYVYLCASLNNELSQGIISIGSAVALNSLSMNHNELSANALALKSTVDKDITRMEKVKPPTNYTSDYMNYVGQLSAISSGLQMFSDDAKANDINALRKDKSYLMSLGSALGQYTPAIKG